MGVVGGYLVTLFRAAARAAAWRRVAPTASGRTYPAGISAMGRVTTRHHPFFGKWRRRLGIVSLRTSHTYAPYFIFVFFVMS